MDSSFPMFDDDYSVRSCDNSVQSSSYSRRIKQKLDWVLPTHYGVIIGKKGATINEICRKSGAAVRIEKNNGGCFAEGTTSQVDNAKTLIRQKIYENKTRIRPPPISDPNWNCVEFVQPDMIGKVIGKNGDTIRSFEQNYGVKLRIENCKLYIYGGLLQDSNKRAIAGLHELLKRNVENEKVLNDGCWEVVQHFDSKLIGMVLGKNYENAKKIERQHGVQIKAMEIGKEYFLLIKGDDDQSKEKLRIRLRRYCLSQKYTPKYIRAELKKIYFVGSCLITLVDSKTNGMSKISTSPLASNLSIEKSFSSVPGLQEGLQQIFTNAKAKIQNMNGSMCNYLIHSGRMLCRKPGGEYLTSDLSSKDFVYQRLKHGDVEIMKTDGLPKIREYLRYDLSILTPKPFIRIRYKLFFKKTTQGFSFISVKETGVNEREFVLINTSPGYVSLRDVKLATVDIIDPTTGKTLRINANIYCQDDEYESQLDTHLQVLNPIFKKIAFNDSDLGLSQMELDIPELPDGYLIPYLRRSIRKTYRFSGSNLLRTSEEKVLKNLEVECADKENEIVDLFFVNEDVSNLLEGDDWEPDEVVDEMESVIKFSDTMLQFLS